MRATVFPINLASHLKNCRCFQCLNYYSIELSIAMTKYKYSASFIVVSSIFVIYLVNGAQFLNDTFVIGAAVAIFFY